MILFIVKYCNKCNFEIFSISTEQECKNKIYSVVYLRNTNTYTQQIKKPKYFPEFIVRLPKNRWHLVIIIICLSII